LSKKQKQQAHNDKDENKAPKEGKSREKFDAYLKYSGMAFQMGIIILVGTYAGKMLDSHFQTQRPYLTVLMALLSIFAALYVSLKDLFTGNQ
jgi:F0F1-type ATP synthase assembly protein I